MRDERRFWTRYIVPWSLPFFDVKRSVSFPKNWGEVSGRWREQDDGVGRTSS